MEVVCDGCKARLNVPEEKLPPGQRISVRCPRCGKKLLVHAQETTDPGVGEGLDSRPAGPGRPEDATVRESGDQAGPPRTDDLPHLKMDEYTVLDSYDEDVNLALVMGGDEARAEKIKDALEGLGYRYVHAKSVKDALGKLRFFNFDLVIVLDGFEGLSLENNPVLRYLNGLSMSIRRRMFVVLVAERFRSMDRMAAFALSANLVIALKDLDRLLIILKRSLADNEKFYKVFFDTLKEVGKG